MAIFGMLSEIKHLLRRTHWGVYAWLARAFRILLLLSLVICIGVFVGFPDLRFIGGLAAVLAVGLRFRTRIQARIPAHGSTKVYTYTALGAIVLFIASVCAGSLLMEIYGIEPLTPGTPPAQ